MADTWPQKDRPELRPEKPAVSPSGPKPQPQPTKGEV